MDHRDFLHSDTLAISSLYGLKNLSCDVDHWPPTGKPLIGDLTSHRVMAPIWLFASRSETIPWNMTIMAADGGAWKGTRSQLKKSIGQSWYGM